MKARAILTILCLVLTGCGLDERLEGCGGEAEALAAAGLKPSADAVFDLAGLTLPLPEGYAYRSSDNTLELFPAPGVYCDSGDWGLYQKGYLQLQIHEAAAPADAFRNFPETHRGHMRGQLGYAPVSPLEYPVTHNALTWQVQAYFNGEYHPQVIFVYLRTGMPAGGGNAGLSIHYFPGDTQQAIAEIVARIDKAMREELREEP